MKRRIAVCMAIMLSAAVGVHAEEGKHLFILSGQSNMAGMDPKLSFIPAVEEKFGKENVIVVKDAHGGRPIRDWSKHQGTVDGVGPKNSRSGLYNRMMKKVRPAIEGQTIKSVTFLWMQGERDARERLSEVYEKAFAGLLKQLEADLGREDINFVVGRLSDFDMENKKYAHWTKIRDILVKIADDSPRGAWVDTDDLNNMTRGPKSWDDLHYTKDGYKILGERFAEKAIELIEK